MADDYENDDINL